VHLQQHLGSTSWEPTVCVPSRLLMLRWNQSGLANKPLGRGMSVLQCWERGRSITSGRTDPGGKARPTEIAGRPAW